MSRKLKIDLFVNYLALGVTACSGLTLNFSIAKLASIEILGLYNISFAIFIVLSQLATFGLNQSILQKYSVKASDVYHSQDLASAMFLGISISCACGVIVYMARGIISEIYSVKLAEYLIPILASLPFFTINKIVTSFFNARREILYLSMLQATRGLGMIVCGGLILFNYMDGVLTTLFLFAEIVVLLVWVAIFINKKLLYHVFSKYIVF